MCTAGEAQAAGAAGLVYIRVGEQGSIDAAKPVKEGLSKQQTQDIIASASAQPVLSTPLYLCCHESWPPEWSLEDPKSPCVATLTHNLQPKVACGQGDLQVQRLKMIESHHWDFSHLVSCRVICCSWRQVLRPLSTRPWTE